MTYLAHIQYITMMDPTVEPETLVPSHFETVTLTVSCRPIGHMLPLVTSSLLTLSFVHAHTMDVL